MPTRTLSTRQVAGLTVTEWSGSGPPVFALPGLASSGATQQHLADALPDRQVLSVDLRGRGAGADLPGPTGLRAHARDVAAILAELDLHDVVVVGHSMGAFLAPIVAQEAPDRVAKLVLIDGGVRPKFPFFMGPALIRLTFTRQLASMRKDWPSIDAVAAAGKFDKMLASRPDLRPAVLAMLAADMTGPPTALRPTANGERCTADAVDCFTGPDAPAALAALTVPAVLLLAENRRFDGQKPFISDAAVAPWTAELPNLTMTRLPGNHVTVAFAPEVAAATTLP